MRFRRNVTAAAVGTVILAASLLAVSARASAPAQGPAPAPAATVADRVLVQFTPKTTNASITATLRAVGAGEVGQIADLGVRVLRVPSGAVDRVVAALSRRGDVGFAEPDRIVRALDVVPNDPYWASQWGPKKINSGSTWTTTTGSSAVVVAVLDTGLSSGLAEFAGRVLPGYNFIGNSTNVSDDNGHGTEVTGVALAQGNNATSVAGMCWACSILPVKVLGADGTGTASAAATGVTWAADRGARVINLSLGSSAASAVLASAVSYAQSKGALVVAAAGNNSSSAAFYPANYPGVLSVAASDQYDKLFSYSDFGSWVEIAAPGSNYTVAPSGNSYNFGGTSSASPLVAGIAGLLLSAVPGATAADVTAAITQTTDPLTAGAVASGRVNAARAMAAIISGSPTASPSPSATVTASPTATGSPTPTTSTNPSPVPPSPTATSSPAIATAIFNGNIPAGGSRSYALTTSGGTVTASVSGLTANVTIELVSNTGSTVASAAGGSGTAVSGTLASGSFTVVVRSTAAKTKYKLSITYYA